MATLPIVPAHLNGKHAAGFRELCRFLETGPDFRRLRVTLESWQGDAPPTDTLPPPKTQGPWIRLTPEPMPVERQTPFMVSSPLKVKVEAFTDSTRAEDTMNLYDLVVRQRIFPGEIVARRAVHDHFSRGYGVMETLPGDPAFGVPGGCVEGSFVMDFWIDG